MPANYILLEKITVNASGASSVTFTNIPQTGYTDLVVKMSARSNRAASEDGLGITVNSASSGYTYRILSGNGSAASSVNTAYEQIWAARVQGNTTTSNTFTSSEFYFPNYTGSTAKSYSGDTVTENNATEAFATMSAVLQSSTSAITSLTIQAINGSLMANSSFYLYGVAALGTTPVIYPKATGGDVIMTNGTHWYHIFNSSGTFVPNTGLTCDYLIIAGGGGGGGANNGSIGGGGGAGGFQYLTSQALSLGTYTVTVGAGGTGGQGAVPSASGTQGSNSVFGSLTASVGGGSGGGASGLGFGFSGGNGGSGGGAGFSASSTTVGGTGTAGQGNNGGNMGAGGGGSGGGGAGGAGSPPSGGVGTANSITGTSITYAIGGQGTGGAGNGVVPATPTANRGIGGDAGWNANGGNGGSGVVIVRYAV
jgi:hypothetical protein